LISYSYGTYNDGYAVFRVSLTGASTIFSLSLSVIIHAA
jgi:hypothetical protein